MRFFCDNQTLLNFTSRQANKLTDKQTDKAEKKAGRQPRKLKRTNLVYKETKNKIGEKVDVWTETLHTKSSSLGSKRANLIISTLLIFLIFLSIDYIVSRCR